MELTHCGSICCAMIPLGVIQTARPLMELLPLLSLCERLFNAICLQATNIGNQDELFSQLKNIGFPAVLKSDGSFGGMGVALIHTGADAKHAFAKLNAYYSVARTLKRLIVDRDANLILPCLRRTRPQVSIQRFLFGKRANAAVACWKGAVLAQVCVEVIASNEATGPATVVSVIAHPGMSQAVERLVRVLNLCGFDFILD